MIPLKIETLYGGAWRSEAMANIKQFMQNAVDGLNVIA